MKHVKRLYDTNNQISFDPQISGNAQVPLVYPLWLFSQKVNFKGLKENISLYLLLLCIT